ncbi:MAG TPA: BrxA/BrxB family bacilliredoxin [Bryobacteraceae bacterium]|nr:BrxA/BrxB family bacilliredoxin [Bryobacteraceae bacterium]
MPRKVRTRDRKQNRSMGVRGSDFGLRAPFLYHARVRYPEQLIAAMRQDLTRHGVEEARTPEDVDKLVGAADANDVVMMVVNSVCGCAAGKARPGVGMALQHATRPAKVATVFAGGDVEATNRVRELAGTLPPSSPCVYLFRGGKPVFLLPRHAIENRQAPEIAKVLTDAFDEHCRPA